jgi:hypothetical protein
MHNFDPPNKWDRASILKSRDVEIFQGGGRGRGGCTPFAHVWLDMSFINHHGPSPYHIYLLNIEPRANIILDDARWYVSKRTKKIYVQYINSILFLPARACNARAGLHSALLLLLLLWWMLYSIFANFVMVARQVVYCEFRLGCKSGSWQVVCRVNIRVELRRVTLISYARPAV